MMKGLLFTLCMLIMVAAQVHETTARTCNVNELQSCYPSFVSGGKVKPTAECCSKLREQGSCFCTFQNDPSLKHFIQDPTNAKNLLANCGVPLPVCPSS